MPRRRSSHEQQEEALLEFNDRQKTMRIATEEAGVAQSGTLHFAFMIYLIKGEVMFISKVSHKGRLQSFMRHPVYGPGR